MNLHDPQQAKLKTALIRRNANWLLVHDAMYSKDDLLTAKEVRESLLLKNYSWANRHECTVWRWMKDIQAIHEAYYPRER
ncbi:MAG: hypothetical protein M3R04_05840 [bacterium]|nr:hypothetical protein [bacterium]